jgi:hypothetical protein
LQYVLTKHGISNLWEQKLTGGAKKQITNFQSGLIFDFFWSRDGKQLALTRGLTRQTALACRAAYVKLGVTGKY